MGLRREGRQIEHAGRRHSCSGNRLGGFLQLITGKQLAVFLAGPADHTKRDKTGILGNRYNPGTLWLLHPQSSKVHPAEGKKT
jgi:hypothetical protein